MPNASFHQFESGDVKKRRSRPASPNHRPAQQLAPAAGVEPVQCIISSGDDEDDDYYFDHGTIIDKNVFQDALMQLRSRDRSSDRSSDGGCSSDRRRSPSSPKFASEMRVSEDAPPTALFPATAAGNLRGKHRAIRHHQIGDQSTLPVCVSSDDEIPSDGVITSDYSSSSEGFSEESSSAAVGPPLLARNVVEKGGADEGDYECDDDDARSGDDTGVGSLSPDLEALFMLFRQNGSNGSLASLFSSPRNAVGSGVDPGLDLGSRVNLGRNNGVVAGVSSEEEEDEEDEVSATALSDEQAAAAAAEEVRGEEVDDDDEESSSHDVDAEAERISMTLTQLGVTPGGGGRVGSSSVPESPAIMCRERSISNIITSAAAAATGGGTKGTRPESKRRQQRYAAQTVEEAMLGVAPAEVSSSPASVVDLPSAASAASAATREAIVASKTRLLAQSKVLCDFLKAHPKVDADALCLALQDCYTRFVLNLPLEYLSRSVHVCFAIQEAYWWYCDLWLERTGATLPKLTMEAFGVLLVECCPVLRLYFGNHDCGHLLAEWRAYSRTIPLRGAVILDAKLSHAIFVQSWKGGRWMFPRGKVDEGETDVRCAVREMKEELGIDLEGLLNPRIYIDCLLEGQSLRLYIVPGILEVTPFGPRKRKEIGDIRWIPLKALPNWPSGLRGPIRHPPPYLYKFWATEAFVQALHGWVTLLRRGSVNRLHLHKYATKQQQRDSSEWTEIKNHKFGYKLPPGDYNEQLLQRYRVMIRTDRPASLVNAQFSRTEIPQLIRFCREKNLPEIEHLLKPQRQTQLVPHTVGLPAQQQQHSGSPIDYSDGENGRGAQPSLRASKKAKRSRKKGSGARGRAAGDMNWLRGDLVDAAAAEPATCREEADEEDVLLSLSDIAHRQPAKATIGPLPPFLSVNRLYQIPLDTPRHVIRALQRPQLHPPIEPPLLAVSAAIGNKAVQQPSSYSVQSRSTVHPPAQFVQSTRQDLPFTSHSYTNPPLLELKMPLQQQKLHTPSQRSIVNDLRKVGIQVGSSTQQPPPRRVILRRGSNPLGGPPGKTPAPTGYPQQPVQQPRQSVAQQAHQNHHAQQVGHSIAHVLGQPLRPASDLEAKRQAVLSLSQRCRSSKKDGSAAKNVRVAARPPVTSSPELVPPTVSYSSAHLIAQLRRLQPSVRNNNYRSVVSTWQRP